MKIKPLIKNVYCNQHWFMRLFKRNGLKLMSVLDTPFSHARSPVLAIPNFSNRGSARKMKHYMFLFEFTMAKRTMLCRFAIKYPPLLHLCTLTGLTDLNASISHAIS